jgi:ABC-2 type transport system ATP-binding protein
LLHDLRLAVPRGMVYALLGRNGAGKSSLVRCLLGQQKPTAGSARLFGRDAWAHRAWAMARVGVVPEEPDAPPEMTAAQILAFAARVYARWDAASTRARLARFAPLDVPFARLSKGQKGAVMLALALGHSPELLVLDDPTLGLDVIARDAVFGEVIGDLADHGTTVFITTHDLAAIERLADRIGILSGGRLALDEDVESLKARWAAPLEQIFTEVTGKGAPA